MPIAKYLNTFVAGILVLALAGCAAGGQRTTAGQFIDDKLITGKVKAALVADPDLKATEIQVDTYNGTVQLSGFVAAPDHIPKAVDLARRVDGVKSVKNDIAIKR